MFSTTLLEKTKEIAALIPEWNELLAVSRTQTVFQSPPFLSTWWETLGVGKKILVAIRDDRGKLVGLAPLFLEPTSTGGQLNLLGCVNVSDYLDVLIDRDTDDVTTIYQTLLSMIEKLDWKKLYWCSLPEASITRSYLKQYFGKLGSVEETVQAVAPLITLPGTWDEYLEMVGRKQRHEIRRKRRKLEEVEHTFEVIDEPSSQDVDTFISLHKQSSQEKDSFWDERHLAFFKKMIPTVASQGKIKLFFLSVGNERVASMLAFDEKTSLALYNSGFILGKYDELSIGSNLIAYTIRYAIEQQKNTYDFLRGDEQYKFRFGAIATNVYDISVVR